MKDTIQTKTLKFHRYCINLKPEHYQYLILLTYRKFNGDLSKTILYLISKYLKYLYKISTIPQKQTMTITYQPKTKQYKQFNITIIPIHWAKLNHIKNYTGYSISAIIRILLEWEMSSTENNDPKIWIQKPQLNFLELLQLPTTLLHSYVLKGQVVLNSREIKMSFYDYFY